MMEKHFDIHKIIEKEKKEMKDPEFDYENHQQMEVAMEKYCNEFREKIFPSKSIIRPSMGPGSQGDSPSKREPTFFQLDAMIISKLQEHESKDQNVKNQAIINLCGNSLIASVFQALLIESVAELFDINVSNEIPLSSKYRH